VRTLVRIAAFEEALDDALFQQPLQAPLGSQFRQVAIGALVERARARVAWAIHAAFGRPSGRSLAASRHDASNAVTLASVASNRIDGTRSSALGARASTPRGRSSLCTG